MDDALHEAEALEVEGPDGGALLGGFPFTIADEVGGVLEGSLGEEELTESGLQFWGKCGVVRGLRCPDEFEFAFEHGAVGVSLADTGFLGIEVGEVLAESAGAAHVVAQLMNPAIDFAFFVVAVLGLGFAVAEEAAPLTEVIEGATQFERVEGMVESAGAEEVGQMMDGGMTVKFLAQLGIQFIQGGLNGDGERLAGGVGDRGEQARGFEGAIEEAGALTAAASLAAGETGGAALDTTGLIATALDIAFHAGFKDADAKTKQGGGGTLLQGDGSPADGAGTEIQTEGIGHLVDSFKKCLTCGTFHN
jgi:hypothetical protein